jgi:predicted dehydrogenase
VQTKQSKQDRRRFLKHTGSIVTAGALTGAAVPMVHAAEDNTINIGLVGCGGRGLGALQQALNADSGIKIYALGDAFQDRAANAAKHLMKDAKIANRADIGDRIFGELDSYKKVIDTLNPGDAVILASPPAFRPLHFEYAVKRGLHIFAEKPLAVDTPGCKKILAANETAKQKNLKVAVGLMMRHHHRTEEAVKAVQDGIIGDIVSCYVYRMHNEFFPPHRNDYTPLQSQLIGFQGFPWGNGGFETDWMIHSVDVACWARGEMLPVSVEGQGGRQVRTVNDQLFDHAAYEYRFDDGVKMVVRLRHQSKTFYYSGDWVYGTKGAARIGEGIMSPKIYKGYKEIPENVIWQPKSNDNNHYQEEHHLFFKAIRSNTTWNEIKRSVDATMTCIMARMAVDSGLEITTQAAWDSTYEMAPGLENWTLSSQAPVLPGQDGRYPLAKPGTTREF